MVRRQLPAAAATSQAAGRAGRGRGSGFAKPSARPERRSGARAGRRFFTSRRSCDDAIEPLGLQAAQAHEIDHAIRRFLAATRAMLFDNSPAHLNRTVTPRMSELAEDAPTFLSTLVARAPARRRALLVVLISAGMFVVLEPFAKLPLTPIWGFIPVYETLVVINDLITAVLLLGQFAIVRSRAILILAIGYLFTASMATCHALTFPGLFAPNGLLGAG